MYVRPENFGPTHVCMCVCVCIYIYIYIYIYKHTHTWLGPKFSSLTYKSRTKWKMLREVYSAIYGDVNIPVSVCVEIKGDYIEK